MTGRFLVTGGAGYVGSHVVLALLEAGADVTVIDDLRQGHRDAVPPGVRLIEANVADLPVLNTLLGEGGWDAVLHFAALSLVGESMRQPFRYLLENGAAGVRLVEACVAHGVPRFVLSSTANLYGHPRELPIREDAPIDPGSPYGESKLIVERALFWADRLHGMRSACLRYFNAAGADPQGRLGEDHDPETHLIPSAIDAALGRRPPLEIFGDDYETPDGTCIRDYVHVSDIAQAHLLALDRLRDGSVTFNVGSGSGYSVREVLDAVEAVTGRPLPHRVAARRAGDPAVLVASAERLIQDTGWRPRYPALRDMIATAYNWRQAHPHGYGDRPTQQDAG